MSCKKSWSQVPGQGGFLTLLVLGPFGEGGARAWGEGGLGWPSYGREEDGVPSSSVRDPSLEVPREPTQKQGCRARPGYGAGQAAHRPCRAEPACKSPPSSPKAAAPRLGLLVTPDGSDLGGELGTKLPGQEGRRATCGHLGCRGLETCPPASSDLWPESGQP